MDYYQNRFSPGKNCPNIVNTIITGPKNGKILYKISSNGYLSPETVFSKEFPFNYGAIPQAIGDTNKPLHAFILSNEPLLPKTIAQIKPIALIKIFTGSIQYYYIVGSATYDPKYSKKEELKDIPKTIKDRITKWLQTTEKLKYDTIKIKWEDHNKAKDAIEHSRRVYAKMNHITH